MMRRSGAKPPADAAMTTMAFIVTDFATPTSLASLERGQSAPTRSFARDASSKYFPSPLPVAAFTITGLRIGRPLKDTRLGASVNFGATVRSVGNHSKFWGDCYFSKLAIAIITQRNYALDKAKYFRYCLEYEKCGIAC